MFLCIKGSSIIDKGIKHHDIVYSSRRRAQYSNVSWLLPPAYLTPSSVYPCKDHGSLIKFQWHREITKLMFFLSALVVHYIKSITKWWKYVNVYMKFIVYDILFILGAIIIVHRMWQFG